jgi:hypothetical protein
MSRLTGARPAVNLQNLTHATSNVSPGCARAARSCSRARSSELGPEAAGAAVRRGAVAEAGAAPDAVPAPGRRAPLTRDRAGQHRTGDRPWRPGYGPARPNREETPVPARNWYVIIAVVAVVIVLAYLLGLFGHGTPPATTTTTAPPATGTATPK